MKTTSLTLIVFTLLLFTFGCSKKDVVVDPVDPWLGTWKGTMSFKEWTSGSNCSWTSIDRTAPWTTLIITKSTFPNKIDLSCTLFKTSATISGTTGIADNATGATFDTNLTLANGKMTFTYRDGRKNSCTVYGSGYTSYTYNVSSIELSK